MSGMLIGAARRAISSRVAQQNLIDTRPERALVLFSGGQDSTTCLAWALACFATVETIGFDYRQRHRVEHAAIPLDGRCALQAQRMLHLKAHGLLLRGGELQRPAALLRVLRFLRFIVVVIRDRLLEWNRLETFSGQN